MPYEIDLQTILLDGFQVNTFRYLLDQFTQQINRLPAVTLQVLDDLLTRKQCLSLLFEAFDLIELLVQDGNFLLQEIVGTLLLADRIVDERISGKYDQCAKHEHQSGQHEKLLTPRLLRFFAMR
ncbi:hypothetical protein SDC9_211534 [bioreactor metagenome]|uniref:Uncharacterized protein n=1 Tax=bioreactor metagenome TaxID=1076179 RepID=A0A645JJB7_9ZZZZ